MYCTHEKRWLDVRMVLRMCGTYYTLYYGLHGHSTMNTQRREVPAFATRNADTASLQGYGSMYYTTPTLCQLRDILTLFRAYL